MMLSTKHQKIVLNLSAPERVLMAIPSAKTFEYKGHQLVAVPHKLQETQVLRNLGFKVPSPVERYYEWSGLYTPFKAQLETASFLTVNNRAFCLNGMGSGKTLSTLWAFDYLRSVGLARKLLVVSPLSTLERTWADEIFRHFPHLSWATLYGTKDKRMRMLGSDVDVYLINHDGVKVLEKALCDRTDIDTVVIDEIASFRNAGTDRWKALNRIIAKRDRVWGLTGTPTPNAPTDAWAQCRLISPERVPKFYNQFRDMTMKQLSQFKWIARDNATEIVAEAMQPSIRFSREDCIDLPPCMFQTRQVEMSVEQKKAYREMLTTLFVELQAGDVQAVNEAVKLQKLVQIASGVVYARDGTHVEIQANNRIQECLDVIEQSGTKVIIFAPFKGSLDYIAKEIGKHYSVAVINGEVSKGQRDRIFTDFQKGTDPHVLVAQPAAMAHGLTLTAASTIIWFAPITSQEIYTQANARITRPGQRYSQLIVNIEGSPVERKLYDRLRQKQAAEGLLLDIIREQEDA